MNMDNANKLPDEATAAADDIRADRYCEREKLSLDAGDVRQERELPASDYRGTGRRARRRTCCWRG